MIKTAKINVITDKMKILIKSLCFKAFWNQSYKDSEYSNIPTEID